ncbi:conserved hypothetical protein [methanotrophic bacterial endosymbiont of Bathymodiolus sp.]|nr:conserved hypothetical protein [methanotrophic bacterial endosymbiont of Bathymodiolus sp.]
MLVFPTPVGVFLTYCCTNDQICSLPHARGGVSPMMDIVSNSLTSSPRPWGCFSGIHLLLVMLDVFPTPVGVFPTSSLLYPCLSSLPHARGGVSDLKLLRMRLMKSSPRPWGCFYSHYTFVAAFLVFPTPVGVFLRRSC